MLKNNFVWIFNYKSNNHVSFPSGVFFTREKAQKWVAGLGIEGLLTPYPIDTSVYDWAVRNHFFTPQVPEESLPDFIAKFIFTHHYQYLDWVKEKIAGQAEPFTLDELHSGEIKTQTGEEAESVTPYPEVWVFNASLPRDIGLASAVFRTKQKAINWIKKKDIEGLLTAYPVDISAYDWAVKNHYFTPKKPYQFSPRFIGTFTGGQKHFHFTRDEAGKLTGDG